MEILIATSNNDKFNIVSRMIKTIKNNNINIKSLKDIEEIPEKEEIGDNLTRAKEKALNAQKYVGSTFDAIIGIDDGVIINDQEYVAIKDHLKDIIVEDTIPIGEKIYITRAYYMVLKDGRSSSCLNKIPYYIRRKLDSYEKGGYPLNQVVSTIDNDLVLSERNNDELNEYYIKYSINDIKNLLEIIDEVDK